MLFKRASSGSNADSSPPPPPLAKTATAARPVMISPEADRAINGVQLRYGILAFALIVMAPTLLIILHSRYPHEPLYRQNGPLALGLCVLWVIPFLIGQAKQANLRIEYARRYASEQRWPQVAAALRAFMEWGQRSLDRDGEGHYLLAQAYERLGRKDQAKKAREFIRKHRSRSEWAKLVGSSPHAVGPRPTIKRAKSVLPTAASVASAAAPSDSEGAAETPRHMTRSGQPHLVRPARRKRF